MNVLSHSCFGYLEKKWKLFTCKLSQWVKSVHIRSSVFSRIRTEYGKILHISPYSVRLRGNAGKMRTRITLNTDNFYAVCVTKQPVLPHQNRRWKTSFMVIFHGDICSNNAVLCTNLFHKVSENIITPSWN